MNPGKEIPENDKDIENERFKWAEDIEDLNEVWLIAKKIFKN